MKPGRAALSIGVLSVLCSACTPSIDLKQALQLTDTRGGWYDAGVVQGKNKLVPGVSFRLRKTSDADIAQVSVNALFRAADGVESGLDNDVFVQSVKFEGDQSEPVAVRSENGYTAEPPQSRADMLKHGQFRDVRVQIFVKHGASQWIDLGRIDVRRQLIAP